MKYPATLSSYLVLKYAVCLPRAPRRWELQGHEATAVQVQEQRVRSGILVHVAERARLPGRDRAGGGWLDISRCRPAHHHRLRSLSSFQGKESQVRHHGVGASTLHAISTLGFGLWTLNFGPHHAKTNASDLSYAATSKSFPSWWRDRDQLADISQNHQHAA